MIHELGSAKRRVALIATAATVAIGSSVTATIYLTDSSHENGEAAASSSASTVPDSPIAYAQALLEFPQDTASDVVSYADEVAIVTAVSEMENPEDSARTSEEGHRGLVTRLVTYKIESIAWHRSGAPSFSDTFTVVQGGWVTRTVNDGNPATSRFAIEGAPWVEVGKQYVMPLALSGKTWEPIMPQAVFPYNGGKVELAPYQSTPLAKTLAGSGLTDITSTFAVAVPDPRVLSHYDLQASARLAAVHGR